MKSKTQFVVLNICLLVILSSCSEAWDLGLIKQNDMQNKSTNAEIDVILNARNSTEARDALASLYLRNKQNPVNVVKVLQNQGFYCATKPINSMIAIACRRVACDKSAPFTIKEKHTSLRISTRKTHQIQNKHTLFLGDVSVFAAVVNYRTCSSDADAQLFEQKIEVI